MVKTIKTKSQKIADKYSLPLKQAEYLSVRLLAKQSIPHILERLKEKLVITAKIYSVCSDEQQKKEFAIGIKRRRELIEFLESDKSIGLSEL